MITIEKSLATDNYVAFLSKKALVTVIAINAS